MHTPLDFFLSPRFWSSHKKTNVKISILEEAPFQGTDEVYATNESGEFHFTKFYIKGFHQGSSCDFPEEESEKINEQLWIIFVTYNSKTLRSNVRIDGSWLIDKAYLRKSLQTGEIIMLPTQYRYNRREYQGIG